MSRRSQCCSATSTNTRDVDFLLVTHCVYYSVLQRCTAGKHQVCACVLNAGKPFYVAGDTSILQTIKLKRFNFVILALHSLWSVTGGPWRPSPHASVGGHAVTS